MKQRSPLAQTLLSLFIPFYIWYWLYSTGKILDERGAHAPRFLLLVGPLIAYLAFVFLLMLGAALPEDAQRTVAILALVAGIPVALAAIVLPIIYYWRFSDAAEKATENKADRTASFVLFLFFAPVSVYLIQNELNNTAANR